LYAARAASVKRGGEARYEFAPRSEIPLRGLGRTSRCSWESVKLARKRSQASGTERGADVRARGARRKFEARASDLKVAIRDCSLGMSSARRDGELREREGLHCTGKRKKKELRR